MPRIDINTLIASAETMAAPPKVYLMLQTALAKPHVNYKEISRIIGTSPSLTARLLQVANSALFGFQTQVASIDRAISLIGTHKLAELVLATEVIHSINNVNCSAFSSTDFCKHSLGCAIAARTLAHSKQQSDIETYFAMGLLHDIGRLIFCFQQAEQQQILIEINKKEGIPLRVLEQQQYGFSHDELGAAFLRKWQLPDAIIATTRHHHSPLSSTTHHYAASIIHIADWVSHTIPLGYNGEHFVPILDQGALSLLAFEESTLNTIIDTTKLQFNDYAKLLM